MGTTADKLTKLNQTKNDIKQAIIDKGVSVADTDPFDEYSGKIGEIQGGGGDDWSPPADWWDIKTILESDTRNYAGKAICLINDADDSIALSDANAYATSDGSYYASTTVTHTWNKALDKECSEGYKTRYIIKYHTSSSLPLLGAYFPRNSLYIVLGLNPTALTTFISLPLTRGVAFLEGFNTSQVTSFANAFSKMPQLRKLPNNLDTSNGNNFSSFCAQDPHLIKLPDSLDTSKNTNFGSILSGCSGLTYLPEGVTFGAASGSPTSTFTGCSKLKKLPPITMTASWWNYFANSCVSIEEAPYVDASLITSATGVFMNCSALRVLNMKLPKVSVDLSTLVSLYKDSLQYIATNAPTITAGSATLTLGSTLITRAGTTIISQLTQKGWTVA